MKSRQIFVFYVVYTLILRDSLRESLKETLSKSTGIRGFGYVLRREGVVGKNETNGSGRSERMNGTKILEGDRNQGSQFPDFVQDKIIQRDSKGTTSGKTPILENLNNKIDSMEEGNSISTLVIGPEDSELDGLEL